MKKQYYIQFALLIVIVPFGLYSFKTILSRWEKNLELGKKTTEQNYLNVPFHEPSNPNTPFTAPENWPTKENRAPLDRSPKEFSSKVITLGTGTPTPNPFRNGAAHALVVNGYPYFVDCGEGWWRGLTKAVQAQKDIDLINTFKFKNLKYMFLTHLHEDHTVGLPSFINNPYKFHDGADKKVYGPEGVDEMISHINAAWEIDRHDVTQADSKRGADGATAVGVPLSENIDNNGRKIFEDENVIVEAFPTKHGALKHTYAYRFTCKPDGRIVVFGGDGTYSEGLVNASKDADLLVVEGITRKNIKYATWGGETEEEKVKTIGEYHMFPNLLKRVYNESKVKNIVLVHVQNYNDPDKFDRHDVLHEMIDEGIQNILMAEDGDIY
ncbi:MBL fold metallo-hydrolase [Flammeovirga agarivorans]|uniref:MBL fold metallo-hydrolase n=1 Tax=Flammeovirga agarivorans TaxID=2726742 RepID=A0A7X8SKN6_9BACT|nr:MBL fold metallo-hydrolase [Flammeovirga agarivorans]NLR91979.1 MBL fold metallo-hydrolase [Flammeovirga agarivorans]